jgi:hypothetical protein
MKIALALLAVMLMGCGQNQPTSDEPKPKSRVKVETLSGAFDSLNVVSLTVDGVEHIVVFNSGGLSVLPR